MAVAKHRTNFAPSIKGRFLQNTLFRISQSPTQANSRKNVEITKWPSFGSATLELRATFASTHFLRIRMQEVSSEMSDRKKKVWSEKWHPGPCRLPGHVGQVSRCLRDQNFFWKTTKKSQYWFSFRNKSPKLLLLKQWLEIWQKAN
jgi:hypothetical protein